MSEEYEINITDIIHTRSWMYETLGKLYITIPNKDLLTSLKDSNIFKELVDIGEKDESVIELSNLIESNDILEESYIDKLKEDYYKLFIGPGSLLAPPWRSVYVSEERIIFDEHTLEIREIFSNYGVSINAENKVPDDHIGYLLQFMSILSNRSRELLNEDKNQDAVDLLYAQKEFLNDYILAWSNELFENIIENSEEKFFINLSKFTISYLNTDMDVLNNLLGEFIKK